MKWLKQTLVALFCIMIMISCEYEFIEVAEPQPPDPNDTTIDTVSFTGQIEPIFVSSSCTNCHNGGLALDLSAGKAYNSIQVNGAVVAVDPNASQIYTYPHPITGTHNTKYSTTDDSKLISDWIYQGALDN